METVIGLAAPLLDLVLAAGDRISRIAEPNDYEYYPVRAGELREELPGREPRPAGRRRGTSEPRGGAGVGASAGRRWAAVAAVIGPLLFVVSQFVLAGMLGADNDAQNLRDIDEQSGQFILANIMRALGAALLALPLYYLFRAVALRSDTFRRQLIGVVIAAPLFIAIGMVLTARRQRGCGIELRRRRSRRHRREAQDLADDEVTGASLTGLAIGFNLGGRLGLAVAMVYTCLHALRTGLLTRFWASLGMALGVVSFLFLPFFMFLLIWFVYLGLVISGRAPGGQPPAWEAGTGDPLADAGRADGRADWPRETRTARTRTTT